MINNKINKTINIQTNNKFKRAMEKKYLLGAIVGDILRTTFRDKDLSSLDLHDYSKLTENGSFSGDTVLTLGVAKYIMENMNLYRGPAQKGRSEHRQQILVKTLRELAHKYPDALYSPACKKWLNSDIQEPMDSNEWSAPIWFSPINLAFEGECDLDSHLKISNEAFSAVLKNDTVHTANKAMTVSQYMIGEEWGGQQTLCDFLACMYNMRWIPVHQIPVAEENWRESVINSFEVALSIFWSGNFINNTPKISIALSELRYLKALPTVVTPFVTTLIQTNHFSQYERMLISACRSLLPDNLLEINDKFFEFLEENGSHYFYEEEEEEEEEEEDDLDDSEDGLISFDDLLKLL